jgi:lipopolysaccharide transport system ATP-binding protein
MVSIKFSSVTKTYARNARQMLFSSLVSRIGRRAGHERLVALNDVSFEVGEGESLAIVGRNGAGKSTILSLIASVSFPDFGTIEVHGRVAALLDLGSGFHPDLTGTENLYVNASLLGFTRRDVVERYDEIVEFSGLGNFMDQPLRTYSSGMVMRLAFAIAVTVRPKILLVDEVLSVGDATFQEKSFERISSLKNSGCSFVCVSHAPVTLNKLCTKAIWIEQGVLRKSGELSAVLAAYQEAEAHTLAIRPD